MAVSYEVRFCNDRKGVGLFATKDLRPGDVIFEEKPLVSSQFVWNETYGYLSCHHCLRPLEGAEENVQRLTNNRNIILPFPELCQTNKNDHRYCDQCGIGYCSERCKEAAWTQYHEYLCYKTRPGLKSLCDAWKEMHYPPETVSIMLLARIIATIEQADDKDMAIKTFLEFTHDIMEERDGSLLKFLGNEFSDKLEKLRSITSEVLPAPNCQAFVSEEGLRTLFALIGRNSQGIGTSPFSIWVKRVEGLEMSSDKRKEINEFIDKIYTQMDEYVGTFLNNEGSGLYRLERCINHSCVPNAEITFPQGDFTLTLVTKTTISPGEEICISYIDDCQLERSRHSRNKHLREYYLFECQCEKCIQQADDPDITSDDEEFEDSDMEE